MKTLKLICATLLLVSGPLAFAQEQVDLAALNAAIETQRQLTEAQRQVILTQNMTFTAEESEQFWPLYREYRADVAKVDDRYINLIQRFAKNFEALEDRAAMDLVKDSFKIESDRLKLTKRYSGKLNRFLPGNKVARLLQIEARLDTMLKLKQMNSIPLAM